MSEEEISEETFDAEINTVINDLIKEAKTLGISPDSLLEKINRKIFSYTTGDGVIWE